MESKFVKHYEEGVAAAKAGAEPLNPYTGPNYAGGRGKEKREAFDRGVASILGTSRKDGRPNVRTRNAMRAVQSGKTERFTDTNALMADLNEKGGSSGSH